MDSATEKPLNVKVAEALGCKSPKFYVDEGWHCRCGSYEHAIGGEASETSEILHYDSDWSATGPLIEKYRITIHPPECASDCDQHPGNKWFAEQVELDQEAYGTTALIAVCNLILALAKQGKLEAA